MKMADCMTRRELRAAMRKPDPWHEMLRRRALLQSKVHGQVAAALRDGVLVRQPCTECSSPNVVGHHPDYAKPLEVQWLCRRHHTLQHVADKRAGRSAWPHGFRDEDC